GRRYVRSFLFSRYVNAPFARVHLIARTILVLCLSGALLRTISTSQPDIVGAGICWSGALLILVFSGVPPRIARLYLLLTLPTLLALLITWIVFNPVAGNVTLLQLPIYAGQLVIGLAVWQAVLIVIVAAYFLWTRKLFLGVIVGIAVTFVLAHWLPLPEWRVTQVAFFHPLTLLVSDQGLLVAVTKMIGYSGMIIATIALVTTARDVELIGALRQLRCPQAVIFFLSTVFRSLDIALSDYETIRQGQLARAIAARPRSFIRSLRDVASMAVPLVAIMIRRSSEIGDALLARGYTLGRPAGQPMADFYERSPWRLIDWAALVLSVLLLCFAVGLHPVVTMLIWRGA
ncbi:MAG TPA: energy-coupling factor transporter transmembrane component T, partial [Ktedonobacteraceae bacterium]